MTDISATDISTGGGLDIATFREYVDIYSADLSRWPVHLIKPALNLIETSPEARASFDAALALDARLRAVDVALADTTVLAASIMAQVVKTPQAGKAAPIAAVIADKALASAQIAAAPRKTLSIFRPFEIFASGGGLMALGVIGFLIGFQPQAQADYPLDPATAIEQTAAADSGLAIALPAGGELE